MSPGVGTHRRGADLESIRDLLADRGIEIHGEQPDVERGSAEAAAQRTSEAADRTMASMSLFMAEVRRHRLLTRGEEAELARRIERGDLAAKERLVNSNLRLVISNARSFAGLDLPLLDLIQEGILGLIRAAEKFDWRKAARHIIRRRSQARAEGARRTRRESGARRAPARRLGPRQPDSPRSGTDFGDAANTCVAAVPSAVRAPTGVATSGRTARSLRGGNSVVPSACRSGRSLRTPCRPRARSARGGSDRRRRCRRS